VDVLMGLRYDRALVEQLLQGVRAMKESVTYQAIVEEGVVKGRLEEARRILLLLGEEQFGTPPGARALASVEAINSLEQLEQLTRRALRVRSWEELLADVAAPEPRRGRRKKQ
jgi:predicted transposase YdaD